MRNLLLALILANILYFLWGLFQGDSDEPGVEVVDESELGPPLSVAQERSEEVIASVGAVLGSGEPSDLNAVVGRSCVTIGPLRKDDAEIAESFYVGENMRVGQRSQQGQIFVGHWVQIRGVPDRTAGNEMIAVLHDGGLGDAYIVETEDEGMKISIGLFGEVEGAERAELQATSLGLPAEISPRMVDAMVYFLDIGLPPGRGAEQIVERYGEDLVAYGDAATCP
jgi:hypothetical protein